LGGKVDIWKQARELVTMSEPKSTGPSPSPCLPTKLPKAISPWGRCKLITFPFKPNSPWTTHQRRKKTNITWKSFTLDGRSHQTGDAAFTPAMPYVLHHSRANTDSHNSHNTQHRRAKQNTLCFLQMALSPARHVLKDTSISIQPCTESLM
jgi:hypothetical protein